MQRCAPTKDEVESGLKSRDTKKRQEWDTELDKKRSLWLDNHNEATLPEPTSLECEVMDFVALMLVEVMEFLRVVST